MPYPSLPDRAIPYHEDGTVVKIVNNADGVVHTFSSAELEDLNDYDCDEIGANFANQTGVQVFLVFFLPEEVELSAVYAVKDSENDANDGEIKNVSGSNDTTNGKDGSWENGTWSDDEPAFNNPPDFDEWRTELSEISFGQAYDTYRIEWKCDTYHSDFDDLLVAHLYGTKASGETADDILFLDADDSDNEYTTPQDFGPVSAGTSEEHNFKIKNDAASLTANSITLTVDDPLDYVRISDDGGSTWVTTVTIGSLGAGVSSSNMKIKSEPSAPPIPLQPERAPIIVEVGSWS